jgi:nucleoside diphosphate kinase
MTTNRTFTADGTNRKAFLTSIEENAVRSSDSDENIISFQVKPITKEFLDWIIAD